MKALSFFAASSLFFCASVDCAAALELSRRSSYAKFAGLAKAIDLNIATMSLAAVWLYLVHFGVNIAARITAAIGLSSFSSSTFFPMGLEPTSIDRSVA